MSSTSPSSTGSADASASTASPSPSSSSSSSSTSPPIFVGFIGISVLTFCLVSLLMWRKLAARRDYQLASNANLNTRGPQNANVPASGRPEMFDAWMGERASDDLKWEKSMPFSVTILTDAESNRTSHAVRKGKAGKHRGTSAKEREREEQGTGSHRLRAAVLVAMPSPLHAPPHAGHVALGGSLRDELAIGLIEMPWIKDGHHSLKRNSS